MSTAHGVTIGPTAVGRTGAAWIHQRDEGTPNSWGMVKQLIASDAAADAWFGTGASSSGDTAISRVRVLAQRGRREQLGPNNWGEVKVLVPSTGSASSFGYDIAVAGA